MENIVEGLTKIKIDLPYDPEIPLGYLSKNINSKSYMHSHVHYIIIYKNQDMETT